jgi:ribosomal protein S18 acetylase RimI-like enzyme
MVLHVRKHNRTAYQFYTKSGFGRAGIERRYYVRPTEDAYIMKKYF